MKKVFLGGTCNESTWRDELISQLKINFFNPVVENWTDAAYEEELHQRNVCDYCLYVITPKMHSVYSVDKNDQTLIALKLNLEKGFEINGFYERDEWSCELCGSHHSYYFVKKENYKEGYLIKAHGDKMLSKNIHNNNVIKKILAEYNVNFINGQIAKLF